MKLLGAGSPVREKLLVLSESLRPVVVVLSDVGDREPGQSNTALDSNPYSHISLERRQESHNGTLRDIRALAEGHTRISDNLKLRLSLIESRI